MIYGDNDHGDMPVPQYALEYELKEARREIKDLRTRLNEIKKGYEGCCHACEPVGAENCRLRELLNHTPEDILMRNQQLAIENERMKWQLEDWKECFTDLAKERDLLWDDLERVTKERDEARRIAAYQYAKHHNGNEDTLVRNFFEFRGWDGFDVMPNKRQKQMMALDNLARLDEELGLLDSNTQTGIPRMPDSPKTGIPRMPDSPETGNLERTDDNGQS